MSRRDERQDADELPDLAGPELEPDAAGGLTEALDPVTADHRMVRRFTLRVVEGPDAGALCASTGERLSIGTHPRAAFCLNDRTMSRFHCEIELEAGRAPVRD